MGDKVAQLSKLLFSWNTTVFGQFPALRVWVDDPVPVVGAPQINQGLPVHLAGIRTGMSPDSKRGGFVPVVIQDVASGKFTDNMPVVVKQRVEHGSDSSQFEELVMDDASD